MEGTGIPLRLTVSEVFPHVFSFMHFIKRSRGMLSMFSHFSVNGTQKILDDTF